MKTLDKILQGEISLQEEFPELHGEIIPPPYSAQMYVLLQAQKDGRLGMPELPTKTAQKPEPSAEAQVGRRKGEGVGQGPFRVRGRTGGGEWLWVCEVSPIWCIGPVEAKAVCFDTLRDLPLFPYGPLLEFWVTGETGAIHPYAVRTDSSYPWMVGEGLALVRTSPSAKYPHCSPSGLPTSRLCPFSPTDRERVEKFLGYAAADLTARKYCKVVGVIRGKVTERLGWDRVVEALRKLHGD